MSEMWDIRSEDQFCDVVIRVNEKVFPCHRNVLSAASAYFRIMFAGSFRESSAREVTLHGVDPNFFESILRFIYTGNVVINDENALDFIEAAEFYGLASLEEHLLEFARDSTRNLSHEDILKMFTAAHITGMSRLFKFFAIHVYEDFGYFSDSPEFITLTWNSLMALVRQAAVAEEPVLSDACVEGILTWIRGQADASADERNSYFEQLIKILRQTKSCTRYIQHVLHSYKGVEEAPVKNAVAVLHERPSKLLRAFVVRPSAGSSREDADVQVFTLHETNARLAWAYSGYFKEAPVGLMRNIVIDDSFYTLIPDSRSGAGATFRRHRRAFAGAPHISLNERQSLRPPTCLTADFDVCGVNNNIFAYSKFVDWIEYPSSVTDPDLTIEELRRGVILYKRDIDKWFPLPCPQKSNNACITCDEKMVYLIGGTYSNRRVQAYDLRTPAWIPLARTHGWYRGAASCIQDGKIWLVGGEMNPTAVEIFDPVSGTWEWGKHQLTRTRIRDGRLVNWDSVYRGRTVVSCQNPSRTNRNIIFSDNFSSCGWSMIPHLRLAMKSNRVAVRENDTVVDMVAF